MMKRTTTKRATEMHETQANYTKAYAAYDAANSAYLAECRELGLLDREDDESFDLQEDISQKHGTSRLFGELRAAEDAMLDWAVEHLSGIDRSRAAELRDLRAMAEKHPSVRRKMTEVVLRVRV